MPDSRSFVNPVVRRPRSVNPSPPTPPEETEPGEPPGPPDEPEPEVES